MSFEMLIGNIDGQPNVPLIEVRAKAPFGRGEPVSPVPEMLTLIYPPESLPWSGLSPFLDTWTAFGVWNTLNFMLLYFCKGRGTSPQTMPVYSHLSTPSQTGAAATVTQRGLFCQRRREEERVSAGGRKRKCLRPHPKDSGDSRVAWG